MKTISLSLGLAALLTGCAQHGMEIREVGAVHRDSSDGTTNGRVAIALGQLANGDVGLALESFRRAAREDPASAEALAGMAECYQRMSRPLLARRYLEQALALRPQEPGLYRALAVVSDGEGKSGEADALRREAALRAAGQTASRQTVTIDLPAAKPALPVDAPAQAVTVILPPARPVAAEAVAEQPQAVELRDAGPRLVRLSMGEVLLVSDRRSPFGSVQVAQNDVIHEPLRVLNAARIQGIAARTRTMLAAKGVERIEIGDAPSRQPISAIHFAAADRNRARALAARLPYRIEMVERAGPLVLFVGRNAGKFA